MNKLNPIKVILSVIDPKYEYDIEIDEIIKNKDLMNPVIKFAQRNGLYYFFIFRLIELNWQDLSSFGKYQWNKELYKLVTLKKTFELLNRIKKYSQIDFILIKACTSVPHVPKDIDILVNIAQKGEIYDIFIREGMITNYSNPVETSFTKEGHMKLDLYYKIQYMSKEFIDEEFLWNSKSIDEIFGIKIQSLNSEASFLLLLIHSVFGHRNMTLLDFLHMISLKDNIRDINVCRDYANKMGWGTVFDICLERLEFIYDKIYKYDEEVPFPYIFDRIFIETCVTSMKDLNIKYGIFFHISFILDRFIYELSRTPFYDYLMYFNIGRRIFNSMVYFIRKRLGDRHGIYR